MFRSRLNGRSNRHCARVGRMIFARGCRDRPRCHGGRCRSVDGFIIAASNDCANSRPRSRRSSVSTSRRRRPTSGGRSAPDKVKIIDVRTPEEILWVGHAPMAWKVPVIAVTYEWDADKKQFPMRPLPDFVARVQKVATPEDTLMVMCRSGGRGAMAVNLLAEAGLQARLQHHRRHGRRLGRRSGQRVPGPAARERLEELGPALDVQDRSGPVGASSRSLRVTNGPRRGSAAPARNNQGSGGSHMKKRRASREELAAGGESAQSRSTESRSREERLTVGKALRQTLAHDRHAAWKRPAKTRDPDRDPGSVESRPIAGTGADPLRTHAAQPVHLPARFCGADGLRPRHHAEHPASGAGLRRLPPDELRPVRHARAQPRLRHQRFRRNAARAVGMGRQAPGRQLCGGLPRRWPLRRAGP